MTNEEKLKNDEEITEEEISDDQTNDDNENTQEQEEVTEPTDEEKIEQLEQQITEYKDKLQRSQADFENFKKRSIKEKQEFVKYANEGLILNVLEAYEDLGRALEVEKDEGVEEIETEHQKFDPYKHEALLTENNDDYENNEIIQDLQKGYTLNNKVIRYSKVIVCKK